MNLRALPLAKAFEEDKHERDEGGRFSGGGGIGGAVALGAAAYGVKRSARAIRRAALGFDLDTSRHAHLYAPSGKGRFGALAARLLLRKSATAFQEQDHPRGEGGRFTAGSAAPQRRTLETTSSWHKLAGRGPRGFKGDADHELPIGSFTKAELKLHRPPSMTRAQHEELLGKLTQIIHGQREATLLAGTVPKKKGVGNRGDILIPPGTERRTVTRAYNHAAMVALHEFGVGKYDFAMDDTLKAEMKPMVPFIHYARKRILNTMLQTHRGAWQPYRQAFGVPFADNRRDHNQQVRLRKPSIDMHQLVKLAFFGELGDLRDPAAA